MMGVAVCIGREGRGGGGAAIRTRVKLERAAVFPVDGALCPTVRGCVGGWRISFIDSLSLSQSALFIAPPLARPPARPRSCGLLGARSSFIYWASVHFQGGKGRKKENGKKGGLPAVCARMLLLPPLLLLLSTLPGDSAASKGCLALALPACLSLALPSLLHAFLASFSFSSVSSSYSSPECDLSLRYFAPSKWMLCHALEPSRLWRQSDPVRIRNEK